MPANRSPPRCEHSQVSSGYSRRQQRGDRPAADRAALVVPAVRAHGEDRPVGRRRPPNRRAGRPAGRCGDVHLPPAHGLPARDASRRAPSGCRPARRADRGGGWRAVGCRRPRCGARARGRGRGRTAGRAARADPTPPGSRPGTSGRRASRWPRASPRVRGRRRCTAPTPRSLRRHHHTLAQQPPDDDERAGQVEPGQGPDGDRVAGRAGHGSPAPPRPGGTAPCRGR